MTTTKEVKYTSGKLETRCSYRDNYKHGLEENWYECGQLQSKENYQNGLKHGLCEEWFSNGKLRISCNYVNNMKNSVCQEYGVNKSKVKCNYVNGIKHGKEKMYDWYGFLQSISEFRNGKLHGSLREFNDKGSIIIDCTYFNGDLHGDEKYYTNDGRLEFIATFYKGKLHGVTKQWEGDELILEEYYYHGTRYPHLLLQKLQSKVKDKILYSKFTSLVKTEGFQQAWMDPQSFGGYFYKQRFLQEMMMEIV